MDLSQCKLSKKEWNLIEIPIDDTEREIVGLIINGFHDTSIVCNNSHTILSKLKLSHSSNMDKMLFAQYFSTDVNALMKTCEHFASCISQKEAPNKFCLPTTDLVRLNSKDKIRINRSFQIIEEGTKKGIFEFAIFNQLQHMITRYAAADSRWMCHYYMLFKCMQYTIPSALQTLRTLVNVILDAWKEQVDVYFLIMNFKDVDLAVLSKFQDISLYSHQRQIYEIFDRSTDKWYTWFQRLQEYMHEHENRIPPPNTKLGKWVYTQFEHAKRGIEAFYSPIIRSAWARFEEKYENSLSDIDSSDYIPPSMKRLVLYTAATGSGKTMTPLGLTEGYRIAYVCAARHVGLALAKTAISMGKKVAFAFGCDTADGIRLHYAAAKEYTRDKKSGGIRKVDNSAGEYVEIILCDVYSCICAMNYMLAFNAKENIILYWDEPTISLDYKEHPLHDIIHNIWKENQIPNIVLSSATLPTQEEIMPVIDEFVDMNSAHRVYEIKSCDCEKNISIVSPFGAIMMPHLYYKNDLTLLKQVAQRCRESNALLRYIDVHEVIKFYKKVFDVCPDIQERLFAQSFMDISCVSTKTIKQGYLDVINALTASAWDSIRDTLKETQLIHPNAYVDANGARLRKARSLDATDLATAGVFITTRDAYTLTNGPTIYITDDMDAISRFYLQQSKISSSVIRQLTKDIQTNEAISQQISELEQEIEREVEKTTGNTTGDKKIERMTSAEDTRNLISRMTQRVENMYGLICPLRINNVFIPNKKEHIEAWAPPGVHTENCFTSNITDEDVKHIMSISGIHITYKVLLLMGIGVLTNDAALGYIEAIKKLSDEQKLIVLITDSDYIYGTNYMFCHGYIGKKLNLTQEKIIQAIGRVGRSSIQQKYTIRLRNLQHYNVLFCPIPSDEKMEVTNMNKLLTEFQ